MSGLLARVLDDKRREIAALRAASPATWDGDASDQSPRGFRAAISGGGIIAELKRRSPSVTSFVNGDEPLVQAGIYAEGGASAISIVTDTPRFGMTLPDVSAVRARVALPILVKDFIIDPLQIHAARRAGADAVLLIARLAPLTLLAELADCARRLKLDALVECHDDEDLAKAAQLGADLVGVNSRNLDTLDVDPAAAGRLLAAAPAGATKVAESGLRTHADLVTAAAQGADAFLIGSALLQDPNPKRLLRNLRGES